VLSIAEKYGIEHESRPGLWSLHRGVTIRSESLESSTLIFLKVCSHVISVK
jgi:hypothetical protein